MAANPGSRPFEMSAQALSGLCDDKHSGFGTPPMRGARELDNLDCYKSDSGAVSAGLAHFGSRLFDKFTDLDRFGRRFPNFFYFCPLAHIEQSLSLNAF